MTPTFFFFVHIHFCRSSHFHFDTVCEIKDIEYDKKGKSGSALYFKGKCALTGQSCKTPLVDSGTTMWNESLVFTFVLNSHLHLRLFSCAHHTFLSLVTECQRTRRKNQEIE